ncbi:hypothetical protein AX774_g203 [Zancudomyces culisetae]|uniref:SCA7 domain-containing protein n=1 Tax=Zancudomyces culisetae TaxID=1213189 RepID=A0A1R1PZD7_ZANCU|nr:hypothetical protein AX774_g203 [Zancudomyces culisetae]|eukprot:OMH86311.1 hypothetical protein AX774_g203 [Zancudomyces culisetae]
MSSRGKPKIQTLVGLKLGCNRQTDAKPHVYNNGLLSSCLIYGNEEDWLPVVKSNIKIGTVPQLSWDTLKKAVNEELDCMLSTPKKDERKALAIKNKDKSDGYKRKRDNSEAIDFELEDNDDDSASTLFAFGDKTKPSGTKRKTKTKAEKKALAGEKESKKKKAAGAAGGKTGSSGTTGIGSRSKSAEFDLDKQCGVIVPPNNNPCTRSLTSAKHARLHDQTNAARRATAMALGEHGSLLYNSLLEDVSDSDEQDSEAEAEKILESVASYQPKPIYEKPFVNLKKRKRTLRVHDLFCDALKPQTTSTGSGSFTSVANVISTHSNPSLAAMMSTMRMAVGVNRPTFGGFHM